MYYFKEGFCWSDINTTFLKSRLKQSSINDVKSMSLYGLSADFPEWYFISIINTDFMSHYVDNFVNGTQTFQINDARQLPIIIPTIPQREALKRLFDSAVDCKMKHKSEENLKMIENKINALIKELFQV